MATESDGTILGILNRHTVMDWLRDPVDSLQHADYADSIWPKKKITPRVPERQGVYKVIIYAVPIEDVLDTERIRGWANLTNRSACVVDSVHVRITDLNRDPLFVGDVSSLLSCEERARAEKYRSMTVLSFIPVFGYVAAIATIPGCNRLEFFVI